MGKGIHFSVDWNLFLLLFDSNTSEVEFPTFSTVIAGPCGYQRSPTMRTYLNISPGSMGHRGSLPGVLLSWTWLLENTSKYDFKTLIRKRLKVSSCKKMWCVCSRRKIRDGIRLLNITTIGQEAQTEAGECWDAQGSSWWILGCEGHFVNYLILLLRNKPQILRGNKTNLLVF